MLTPKQNVLRFVATLPDNATYVQIKYHVDVMHAIEEGEEDIKAGRVIDHDELFDRLEAEYAESQAKVDGK
jgi:predicted transcriptional regulator